MSLLLGFIALACITAGLKYEDEKTLGSADLYFAAKHVTSYSNEALQIAYKSQNQPLIGAYRQTYIQQLDNDVNNVTDKLSTHEVRPDVQTQAGQLQDICNKLDNVLGTLMRDPTDTAFAASIDQLQVLANQASAVEDSV